jgi:RNA polymerase sigma-70 factor (ECF subfamily)
VSDALEALKPEQREVVHLRLIEGRSVAEVAALLGRTEGAVKVTQMRALKAMRRRLRAV